MAVELNFEKAAHVVRPALAPALVYCHVMIREP